MNKIVYSLLISSLLFVNIFADGDSNKFDEIRKQKIHEIHEIDAEWLPKILPQLNTLDEEGQAPLHKLVFMLNDHKELKILHVWDVDMDKQELVEEFTALEKVQIDAMVEAIKDLIKAGAQVDLPTSCGKTALFFAAAFNQPEVISTLIAAGADINGKNGNVPLHIAACNGNKEAVECLLSNGADPNIKDKKGRTPLHQAARGVFRFKAIGTEKLQDYGAVVALLIKHGALSPIKDNDEATPAQLARKKQQECYPYLYPEYKDWMIEEFIYALGAR